MVSEPATRPRSSDPLDLIWRYSSGNMATVALASLLAATLVLAALVPQTPAELTGAQTTHWLTNTVAAHGRLGPAMSALGVFEILHTVWLQLLLALLAFHLLLRSASEGRRLWQTRRQIAPLPPLDAPAQSIVLPGPFEDNSQHAVVVLRGAGLPPAECEASARRLTLYGVRRKSGALGPMLAYLGTLLVLLGLFTNGVAGWSASNISLAAGSDTKLDAAPGLQLKLESVAGPESDPVSTVLLQDPGRGSARLGVTVQRPATWRGLWLAERATGPALAVTGHDDQGRSVVFELPGASPQVGEAVHVLFTNTQTEQVFAAQGRNVAFRVVNYPTLPERGITEQVFLVEAYRGADSTPAVSQLVRGPASLTLAGMVFAFQPERHAIVSLAYLPGLWLLVPGAFIALTGLVLWLWWRKVEGWVSLTLQGSSVKANIRAIAALEADTDRARIAAELKDASQ